MRRTLVAAAITATAALFATSGCTSATPIASSPVIITPSATAAPSATPTPTPTPVPVPSATVTVTAKPTPKPVFTSMEAAAKHLYAAWEAKDKTAATEGAAPAAVSALFGKTWKSGTYFFGGWVERTGLHDT